MTEWLSNFFLSKVTATNAATVLLCVVVTLVVWPWLSQVTLERSIPEDYIFPIVVMATLTFSYLSVCLVIFWTQKVWKFIDKLKDKSRSQVQHEEFKENVRISLPALDKEILDLLTRLKSSETTIDLRERGVAWLLREKWMHKTVQTSASKFVAKLDPCVKNLLIEYENSELLKVITHTVDNIRGHHQEFLSIFWAEKIPFGTQTSGELMPNKVYSAGRFLVQKGLLQLSIITDGAIAQEVFSLPDETEAVLLEKIYEISPKRKVVKVDLNFVWGSDASGSGAVGGIARKT
ncbi:hypothetical protein [Desulfonatronum lacustre]|uniref:hypothetical protein n=1 Tax=Desulfonatronum lacustre TaxID=66849 RepID=UPI0012EBB150|nr:hypothetical protein [Desulfonatronum lacustre]